MGITQLLVFLTFLVVACVYGVSGIRVANTTQLPPSGDDFTPQCTQGSISINQGPAGTLPDGIPLYLVVILNECLNCSVTKLHLNCGEFASARMVNPEVFKRVKVDNCVVNNGRPFAPGQILSFEYSNTFMYPLSVKSFVGCD